MAENARILIIDDNLSVLNSLELFLSQHFQQVTTLKSPNQIESILKKEKIDLVLLDMNFTAGVNTGNEGIYWLRKIHDIDGSIAVVLITAYGNIGLAVDAIKEGASDFILKPWDNKKLLSTIQIALNLKLSRDEIKLLKEQQERMAFDRDREMEFIIEGSAKMRKLDELISKVAATDASVLILGENGTGKEVVAREVHKRSERKSRNMIRVDIGSLKDTLFESELFGHVKGAFTDARENRAGRFELASGSTIFLDEIGNLSLALQAKLLSALENKKITPVGSNKEIPVDIRVISASNKDIPEMVKKGLFREDLFFRLNTILLELPPLRERTESILPLAENFLKKYSARYDKRNIKLNDQAAGRLLSWSWPGNIRELKHTMEKAVILSNGKLITENDLGLGEMNPSKDLKLSDLSLEEGEKLIIEKALIKNNWNITETAEALKIGRQTLYRKIEKYGL